MEDAGDRRSPRLPSRRRASPLRHPSHHQHHQHHRQPPQSPQPCSPQHLGAQASLSQPHYQNLNLLQLHHQQQMQYAQVASQGGAPPPPPAPMAPYHDPRISQLFDPLSRLSELSACSSSPPTSSAGPSPPPPGGGGSPRLPPRRSRLHALSAASSGSSLGGGGGGGRPPSSSSSLISDGVDPMDVMMGGDMAAGGPSSPLLPPPPPSGAGGGVWGLGDEGIIGDGVDWHERCLRLQLELHQFRHQAGRVRDLLREKLAELEQRVVEAESRAEEAEDKVRMMEQRLAEAEWTTQCAGAASSSSGSVSATPSIGSDPAVVKEKEIVINKLETQVEEQRQLRLQDAKQVEAKAAKIKEWVTNKLRELEEQNQHLREQNQKCNEQLELLRNHLAHLSQLGVARLPASAIAAAKDRASIGVNCHKILHSQESPRCSSIDGEGAGSEDSLAPDLPVRPASTSLPYPSRRRSDGGSRTQSDSEPEPLYAEVDPNKKRSGSGASSGIVAPNSSPAHPKRRSSSARLRDAAASLSPRSPLDALDASLPSAASLARSLASSAAANSIPEGSPRLSHRKPSDEYRTLTQDLQAAVESLALLPPSAIAAAAGAGATGPPMPEASISASSSEVHDYAEIYTPSKERAAWVGIGGDSSGGGSATGSMGGTRESDGSSGSGASGCVPEDGKPPTPPLHRFPSWESRIYQVAADGLQVAAPVVNGACGSLRAMQQPSQQTSAGYYDISVPVYATVKGRASQIRSMPFTGDSSDDSSDGEEHGAEARGGGTTTTTSSGSGGSGGGALGSCGGGGGGGGAGDTDASLSGGSGSSPSKSMKTTSSLSPAKRSSSSPSKSLRRDTSLESGMSDDYAIPPDAFSCETTSIESSMPSLALRTSLYTDTPKKESLEKMGYLTKLGGKLKTWRKRWFVLKNGVLTYWKSQHTYDNNLQSDVSRKPQGQIVLDEVCRVTRAEGAATFEISTGKKTYYLTADSIANMEDWIRVLQNVQRRNATKLLLSKEDNKPTIQGWLTKVKNGHAKKCWCVLIGKMFLYFKTPSDMNPLGQINMRDARVEEVDHVSDSDSEDREGDSSQNADLTIGIFPSHQGPTYLLMPGKQEKDSWMYHLTVVSGGGASAGTQYEQLVQKLMETDGDPNCVLWRHPHLLHSKESIVAPLTTLSSDALQAEAVKLFKSCQLFISVHLDSAGIDYHVVLAQNALQQCLDVPELQAEFVCALVKQTSRHTHHKIGVQQLLLCATQSLFMCDSANAQKGSPTSQQSAAALPLDCKTNPPSFVFVQGWQLLALAVSLFVPRNNRLLWYLKLHLHRNADSKSECGKYAAYCQRALERTLQNGGRQAKPSRMEVLSILLKNPYHHSLPHAIPVHLLNGTYQVVSFDGSTTIEEFLTTLNQEIGCRDVSHSGFTLFSDDPIEKDLEHFIDPQAKLCDVISKWETALREKGSGKFENTRVIQLTFKNRLYWRNGAKMETDKEKLLLCYQVNQQVVQGRFPLNRELAMELTSLMAQIDFGEYNADRCRGSGGTSGNPHHQAQQVLDKFYPIRYREGITPDEQRELLESLTEKWMSLKGRSLLDCVRIYLTCTRKWPFFGATLFQAKLKSGNAGEVAIGQEVWLAVTEDSVTLLELSSMHALSRHPYTSIVTFGGCQDDFMLVVVNPDGGGSHRLLFILSKPKILELTLLIADYMNAMGHLGTLPGTPQTGTLTRNGSHRSIHRPRGHHGKGEGTMGGSANTTLVQSTTTTAPVSHRLGAEPDILRSTPDHQGGEPPPSRLQRTDSKKRAQHLDSGVA
ncbi:uncharacterized protein CG43867 isoform X5 [Ischnura elegans]|uniref:uncharacterized protein CG43867 isoform X5 n=1 Tax=Ischnura elegans TaxID=197161 RepID=UPI001ED88473|nr:uncharacterized protein CG43867 isoform X5 [Ischnura elegans]